jgi:hypothetical protein
MSLNSFGSSGGGLTNTKIGTNALSTVGVANVAYDNTAIGRDALRLLSDSANFTSV